MPPGRGHPPRAGTRRRGGAGPNRVDHAPSGSRPCRRRSRRAPPIRRRGRPTDGTGPTAMPARAPRRRWMLRSPGSMTASASATPAISSRSHSAALPTSTNDTSSAARTAAPSTADGNAAKSTRINRRRTKGPSIAGARAVTSFCRPPVLLDWPGCRRFSVESVRKGLRSTWIASMSTPTLVHNRCRMGRRPASVPEKLPGGNTDSGSSSTSRLSASPPKSASSH